ncbi:MAG: type II toxin-antitoxin system HicB family antitoxin [Leptolyngbyaceae bacterium]|nr:type II toxin-antitoxin system HicB family antitoxin [Leptolyngbyaceae bacterium]
MKYTIVIQWSDEDQCYVVSLPEWGDYCYTHGDTYGEDIRGSRNLIPYLLNGSQRL